MIEAQINALNGDIDTQKQDYETRIENLNSAHAQEINEKQTVIDELEKAKKELENTNALIVAQMQSMRREQGKKDEVDYSTREGFAELERMYEQFTLLYKEQWSMTKEKIRKDLLKPYKKSQKLAKRMNRRMKKVKKNKK